MKGSFLALIAGALPLARSDAASPVDKVIQLLADMQTKIISEGEEAQKAYSKTSEWCEERSKNLGFDIKTAKAEVAELKATIEKETALIETMTSKVETLAGSTATDEADLKAATSIRTEEAADFTAEDKELIEVINSLQRAIGILEREMQKGGASMMQLKNAGSLVDALNILVQSASLNSADASRLTALVQSSQESDSDGIDAPAAATYEGHSGSIIETLESLLEKAEGQLDDARKKETSAAHNFAMLKQSLEDEIKFANKDMDTAKKAAAQSGEQKSTAEGNLQVTSKDLKVGGGSLADLHQTCLTKAQDFEAQTQSRSEELKALATAKSSLVDNTAAANSHAYGLNQVSFLQLTRSALSSGADLAHFEAVHLVRDLARKMKSTGLAQLASRMASAVRMGAAEGGGDPFGKVKGLIADMIERLEGEAQADASHKSYCDKELAESNLKKDDKTADIDKLSTRIDQMQAQSSQLKGQVVALQRSLSELAAAGAEMDTIRQREHKDFKTFKADTEQGLEGVKMALKVLREYYGKDSAHTAAEGAGTSVIGLLEVVESDFSKGLAEMTATEDSSQATYETETKENQIEKAGKDQDVAYQTKEAAALDKAVADATSDRSGVQSQLDAVMEYLDTLTKQCVAKAETFSERKGRFEAEIAGLREALKVLDSETVLLQQGTRRSLRGVHKH